MCEASQLAARGLERQRKIKKSLSAIAKDATIITTHDNP